MIYSQSGCKGVKMPLLTISVTMSHTPPRLSRPRVHPDCLKRPILYVTSNATADLDHAPMQQHAWPNETNAPSLVHRAIREPSVGASPLY